MLRRQWVRLLLWLLLSLGLNLWMICWECNKYFSCVAIMSERSPLPHNLEGHFDFLWMMRQPFLESCDYMLHLPWYFSTNTTSLSYQHICDKTTCRAYDAIASLPVHHQHQIKSSVWDQILWLNTGSESATRGRIFLIYCVSSSQCEPNQTF